MPRDATAGRFSGVKRVPARACHVADAIGHLLDADLGAPRTPVTEVCQPPSAAVHNEFRGPGTMVAGRLVSLDVFRGLTIAGMILVNNPGSWSAVYAPLTHAEWHGWTPTDLIFPFFLFAVGVSIALALGPRLEADESPARLVRRVAVRSLVLVALGLLLAGFPAYDL